MRTAVVLANALLLSITLLAPAQSAFASGAALKIDRVDFFGPMMVILGKQFDQGELTVSIAGVGELDILSVDASRIETDLPTQHATPNARVHPAPTSYRRRSRRARSRA